MGTATSKRRPTVITTAALDKPRLPTGARPRVSSSLSSASSSRSASAQRRGGDQHDDELSPIELEDAVDPFLSPPPPHHLTAAGGGMDASSLASAAIARGSSSGADDSSQCEVASPSTYERLGRLRAERIEQLRREEDELRRWLADIEVSPAPSAHQQPQQQQHERAASPLPASRVYQAPPVVNAAPQPPQRKPLTVSTASPTAVAGDTAGDRAAAKEARRRARPERFKFTSFDITRSRELQDLLWSFSPISGPPSFRLLPGTTLTTVMASISAPTPPASGAKSFSFPSTSSSDSSAATTITGSSDASPRPSLTSLFVPPPGYTGAHFASAAATSSAAGATDSPSSWVPLSSPVSFTIPAGLGTMRSPGLGRSPAGGATGSFDPSPKHTRVSSFRLLRPRPLAMHSEDDEDEAARQQKARDLLKKVVQEQQRRLETLADDEEERADGPDRQDRDDEDDDDHNDTRERIEHEDDDVNDDDEEDGEIASDDDHERLTRMQRRQAAAAAAGGNDRRASTASTKSVASPRSPSWRLTIQPSPTSATGNGSKPATPTSSKSTIYHESPSASPPSVPAGRAFAAGGTGAGSSRAPPLFFTPASSADLTAAVAAATAALASAGTATPRSAAIIASAFNPSPKQPRRPSVLTPRSSRAAAAKFPPPPSFAPPPPPPGSPPPPRSPSASPRAFLTLRGAASSSHHHRSSSRVPAVNCVGSISLSPHAAALPFSFSVGSAEELIHAAPTPVAPPTPPPPPPADYDDDEPDEESTAAAAPRSAPPAIDRATYARALARRDRRERAVKRLAQARSNNQQVEIEVRMLGS